MSAADPFRPALPLSDLVAAGLFLRREVGATSRWLLLRGRRSSEWGFPKGHQDPGEDLVTTALRETAEETGMALVAITAPPLLLHYQVPSGRRKTVAYYPAVTIQTDVILSAEHRDHCWATRTEVERLVNHPNLVRLFRDHLAAPC